MSGHLDRRGALRVAAAACITGLAGCAGPAPPPMRSFYLSALGGPPPGTSRGDWSLVVPPPQTPPALRTSRIAQRIGPNELDYYANAEWGDTAPIMFQTVLIRSLERSGALPVVANERQRLRPDFMLTISLVPFFADGALGTAPTARVGVDAQLIRSRGREVVATTSIEKEAQAASADLEAIVAAFDAASKEVLTELIPWAVSAGNAEWATS